MFDETYRYSLAIGYLCCEAPLNNGEPRKPSFRYSLSKKGYMRYFV